MVQPFIGISIYLGIIRHLHSVIAHQINAIEKTPKRKVWFQYWETRITYDKSYFTRLNYVHNNPVQHGLVLYADQYEWCSAKWFKLYADKSFFRTVSSFKFDKVNVKDDF
ncbi:MAG: hypothetical protein QME42_09780 [bacterium]|nr:hypothetical protein [bacterium]